MGFCGGDNDDEPPKARIERWSTVPAGSDPWMAPELAGIAIRGTIANCETSKRYIRTSRVVSVTGRRVTTRSGSVYELGEPHPDFVAWLKESGKEFDPEVPIKVIL